MLLNYFAVKLELIFTTDSKAFTEAVSLGKPRNAYMNMMACEMTVREFETVLRESGEDVTCDLIGGASERVASYEARGVEKKDREASWYSEVKSGCERMQV